MNTKRVGLAIGAALAATLTLSSCAANETPSSTGSSGSSQAAALSGQLNGVGSSAQSNAQDAWRKAFQTTNSGVTVNYDPQGSGAGRTAFIAGGADFAGSDSPLAAADLASTFKVCKAGTKGIDIPVYVSPIALVFNVSGVKTLNLDAATIAKIFKGTIKNWNDPAIKALNAGETFPNLAIDPVHRSDKSGTTNNFTDYLNQVAPSIWTEAKNDVFPYNTGDGALKGSGVVSAVTNGKGTIGYVDNSSAGKLDVAKVKVGTTYVAPTAAGASKIAETSPLAAGDSANDIIVKINRTTTDATEYPITLVSNFIACQTYTDSAKGALVAAYAKYVTSADGQQAAASSAGSAPMTGALLTKAEAAAASIK